MGKLQTGGAKGSCSTAPPPASALSALFPKVFVDDVNGKVEEIPKAVKFATPSKDEEEEGDVSVTESFQEETSVEDVDSDITGVSAISSVNTSVNNRSKRTSSSDWSCPLPMDDSVEVFLAKRINNSQVVNVSTDSSSVLEISKGKVSDSSLMDF